MHGKKIIKQRSITYHYITPILTDISVTRGAFR